MTLTVDLARPDRGLTLHLAALLLLIFELLIELSASVLDEINLRVMFHNNRGRVVLLPNYGGRLGFKVNLALNRLFIGLVHH